MTVLLSPTAVRALLLAAFLACAAALTAPAARGAGSEILGAGSVSVGTNKTPSLTLPAPTIVLADEFSWREFTKYWGRQAGSLGGIVGTVLLVAALAVLIIMSKGRG
jgi:hypothetical protein